MQSGTIPHHCINFTTKKHAARYGKPQRIQNYWSYFENQLGPVNTKNHDYAILRVWKSPTLISPHRAAVCRRQRGNVTLDNLQVLNAILYVAEQGANGAACQSGSATGTPSIRA